MESENADLGPACRAFALSSLDPGFDAVEVEDVEFAALKLHQVVFIFVLFEAHGAEGSVVDCQLRKCFFHLIELVCALNNRILPLKSYLFMNLIDVRVLFTLF